MCSSHKMIPIYFLQHSKVWSILHHGSVGQVHKKVLPNTFINLFGIFFVVVFVVVVFHHKICLFIIFISFFDKVSNLHNRILTNQKHKFLVSNCQWNCMCVTVTPSSSASSNQNGPITPRLDMATEAVYLTECKGL